MPVGSSVEVVGVKETIKALRALDPEHKKEFVRAIKGVVQPMVSQARASYPAMPLSGMARPVGSRFFWDAAKVKTNVKIKNSTRRDKSAVVYVTQMNPAGVIFEVAGTGNRFGQNLRPRNARVLWPTYDRNAAGILKGVGEIVKSAEKTVQGMVN
jgi:hypothetical protein